MSHPPPVKVAILDLYDGIVNQGIMAIQKVLENFEDEHGFQFKIEIFDVRGSNQLPDTDHDIYLSSGGPGDPLASEGSEWENNYFDLIERLQRHNHTEGTIKKHVLFICHSFQLMCRRWRLGTVNLRKIPSYGVVPVQITGYEPLLASLSDPFYALDSRSWQVVHPDQERFEQTGATLVATEQEPGEQDDPPAMMAIRFDPYFFGTQFHPEADAEILTEYLTGADKRHELIADRGEAGYYALLADVQDPAKIKATQHTIIPQFLLQAISGS
ncbi:GMP synthase [Mucilaginibacter daejeonensis]|uniref:type 1 glutamine amidotransferase n=1 Tax=Mucilaginibacter daejeonensis TaxID=398049 RepID=UPI001D16FF48|nr:GMP synthase [Mucilaginibacter daejeonensis]UEG52885.1 GMP synthase [Mucilaginibacter daejeonensis]